jgi:hypothetical protein
MVAAGMVHDGGASSDVALSSDGGTPSRASPIGGHRRKLKKGNLTKSLGWLSKFNNVIECFGKDISSAQKVRVARTVALCLTYFEVHPYRHTDSDPAPPPVIATSRDTGGVAWICINNGNTI